MAKKTLLATFLVLVIVLALSVAIASAQEGNGLNATTQAQSEATKLMRLIVRNNSDNFLSIALTSVDGKENYVLWIPAGEERVFAIPKGKYTRTTYACNKSDTGTLDLTRQTRIVFLSCTGAPTRWGEPTMEKISLDEDGPSGPGWQYRYD